MYSGRLKWAKTPRVGLSHLIKITRHSWSSDRYLMIADHLHYIRDLLIIPFIFLDSFNFLFGWCKIGPFLPFVDLFWRSFVTKTSGNYACTAILGLKLGTFWLYALSLIRTILYSYCVMSMDGFLVWNCRNMDIYHRKTTVLTFLDPNFHWNDGKHSFWWLFLATGIIPAKKQHFWEFD